MRKLLAISLVLLFCNCGDVNTEPNWAYYSPDLKRRIDNAGCNDLQKEFNTAESNSDGQRARTGEGNSLLMGYIDGKMREKGCY